MSCPQDSVTAVRPGSTRVLVTELSGPDQMNPTPTANEDPEVMLERYLSPEKLRTLTGREDLCEVTSLEMSVDTRENTLGNIGAYLPSLVQLKLNSSLIMSVRDLGTKLSNLQVLWMSRCGLTDLDGILSLSSLKELYVAYNDISDLSQVSMLEHLELLDLEGNNVNDLIQVQFLGLCSQLCTLTLEGNPICSLPHPDAAQAESYSYRATVKELVPQLRCLDDASVEETGPRCHSTTMQDWVVLKESIKDTAGAEGLEPREERPASAHAFSRPQTPVRPGTSPYTQPHCQPSSQRSCSRPVSAPVSRPTSASSDPTSLDEDSSDLTHDEVSKGRANPVTVRSGDSCWVQPTGGVGRVICGNPGRALRLCRQKSRAPASCSNPCAQPKHAPESPFDLEETEGEDRKDVFAEIMAWREEHHKRLMMIERERLPQVMKVCHSDDDDEEEEDEGRGQWFSITCEEEEAEEEKEGGGRPGSNHKMVSPDFSFRPTLPACLPEREAVFSEVSRLSLSPDPPVCPSPPLTMEAPPGGHSGLLEMRARRLRVTVHAAGSPVMESQAVSEVLVLETEEGEPKIQLLEASCHSHPDRPVLKLAVLSHSSQCAETEESNPQQSNAIGFPLRPAPPVCPRPRTARAALRRLPHRAALSPARGPSHCN